MEMYAIAKMPTGRASSLFNTALFSSKKEAERYRQWYITKVNAERIAHHQFWKSDTMEDDLILQVVKVII